MDKIKDFLFCFSRAEIALWLASVSLISLAFFGFDRSNTLAYAATLIGVTSILFNAKGNPVGQALTVVFSVMYGIEAYGCAYYGEMITYLGMTAPMAVVALITWLKNPSESSKAQVKANRLKGAELFLLAPLTAGVTVGFYFVLRYFHTANLWLSTFSVATSFAAVYFTFRRSPYFSLAYAANDCVLIALWISATLRDISYLSVTVCFVVFLVNDIYAFISWIKMRKNQQKHASERAA